MVSTQRLTSLHQNRINRKATGAAERLRQRGHWQHWYQHLLIYPNITPMVDRLPLDAAACQETALALHRFGAAQCGATQKAQAAWFTQKSELERICESIAIAAN